jgi:hypothetical protein
LPSEGIRVRTTGTLVINDKDDVTTTYNGSSKGYFVAVDQADAVVMYSSSLDEPYSLNKPMFTDAGVYTVYYKVAKRGFKTEYGSYIVTINKADHDDRILDEIEIMKGEDPLSYFTVEDYLNEGEQATLEGTQGTILYKVTSKNYEDYYIRVPVKVKEPPAPPAPTPSSPEPAPASPAPAPVPAPVQKPEPAPEPTPAPAPEPAPEPEPAPVAKKTTKIVRPEPTPEAPTQGKVTVSMDLKNSAKVSAVLADSDAVANQLITDEQRESIKNGSNFEIKVELAPLDVTDIETDQIETIEKGLTGFDSTIPNITIANYIDISLFMRKDDEDWNQINSTAEPIEIVMDIPEEYRGLSDVYYILRYHEGEITLLEDLDDNPDTITISTAFFSTYVLLYRAAPVIETPSVEPPAVEDVVEEEKCHVCHMCPTFLGICLFIWLLIIVGALTFILSVLVLKDNKKEMEKQKAGDVAIT